MYRSPTWSWSQLWIPFLFCCIFLSLSCLLNGMHVKQDVLEVVVRFLAPVASNISTSLFPSADSRRDYQWRSPVHCSEYGFFYRTILQPDDLFLVAPACWYLFIACQFIQATLQSRVDFASGHTLCMESL